jgi:hypothetical protein
MNFHKKKLITLLITLTLLAIANKIFGQLNFSDGLLSTSWLYWSGMTVLFYLTYYVFTLKCPNPDCRKPQIYRGVSLKDLHWPNDKCFACGTKLKTRKP